MDRRLDRETHIGKNRHLRVERRKASSFPLHAHEYYEMEIVLSGQGIHRLGEQVYPLERGSIFILSPADFHSVEVTEEMVLWNIAFDETAAQPLQTPICRSLTEEELEKFDMAARLLSKENTHFQPLLDYLLALLMPPAEEPLTPIRKAILYIETHFREDPSLAEAAEQACLSPVYFGALFKKETGETYISYLNSCKVRCAAMLLESGMSVTEACFASGFGSLSGFLYTYKQKMGVSPSKSILSKKRKIK
ncbi:MAG: helix-turn-helix domain-containing protein [Clostridia bacterium]|nr:helix-turn-helix domain-containing protein [Clostridia bacterium]